jgi:hypothetical protein
LGNDDVVRCDLSVSNLNTDAAFVALSYTWGDAKLTEEIYVNGVSFQATVNLVAFLKRRRELQASGDRLHTLPIWIDAICINQADTQEKNRQLPLMKYVYQKARKVVAWIGEPDDDDLILKDTPVILKDTPVMNQSDHQEKRGQTRRVKDIYRKVKKVMPWTKKPHEDESILKNRLLITSPTLYGRFLYALALIEDIGKRGKLGGPFDAKHWVNQSPYREALCESDYPDSFEPPFENPYHNTTWNTISRIFGRQYWKRAWTVQELALPSLRDVVVHCSFATFEYASILEFRDFLTGLLWNRPTSMQIKHWRALQSVPETRDIQTTLSRRIWFSATRAFEATLEANVKAAASIGLKLPETH